MAVPKHVRARAAGRSGRGEAGKSREQAEPDEARAPRTGARKTVMGYIAELPRFLRLLWGLVSDPRVALVDKLLVGGAIAYIVMPLDMIPDVIPFLGEVDDVYLLVMALRRLMRNAGRAILLSHWTGDPLELRDLNLRHALAAAAFFLPRRIRRRLRIMGR